jgi:hypothetical protein
MAPQTHKGLAKLKLKVPSNVTLSVQTSGLIHDVVWYEVTKAPEKHTISIFSAKNVDNHLPDYAASYPR